MSRLQNYWKHSSAWIADRFKAILPIARRIILQARFVSAAGFLFARNAISERWSKLPASPWVRGSILAGTVMFLAFPVVAWFGSADTADLKLPQAQPAAKSFDDKILAIVQATPAGKISLGDERKEVFIVFNHPMVPLAVLDDTTREVFSITPRVKGRFRWYGSRIAAFVPEEDWQPGAEYTVRIPANVAALNGLKLQDTVTFKFRFEIPPLEVNNVSPGTYEKIRYTQLFNLSFNFPVSAAALKNKLTLKQNAKAVSYSLREWQETDWRGRKKKKDGRTWQLIPAADFSRAAKVELRIAKGLKADGLLTELAQDFERTYEAYGELTMDFSGAPGTWRERYDSRFRFSNPVSAKQAARAIKFNPPCKVIWLPEGETTQISLASFAVEPGKSYKITVAQFPDVLGNRLKEGGKYEITLPDRDQFIERVESGSVIEAEMAQNYPINVSNLSDLRAQVREFTLDEVLQFASDSGAYSLHGYLQGKSSGKTVDFKTGIKHNAIGRSAFNLAPHLANKRGWLLAEIFDPNADTKDRTTISESIQSTDLAITARPALGGSHVWINSLHSGIPQADVTVSRYTMNRLDGDCKTNSDGYCLIAGAGPRDNDKNLVYVAVKGKDKAFVTSKEQRLSISPGGGGFAYDINQPQFRGVIVFDRKLHTPGDVVYFKAVLTRKKGDTLTQLKRQAVKAEVSAADGKSIYSKSLKTSEMGGVGGEVEIPKGAPLGHYTLAFTSDDFGNQAVQDTFQVEEFRPVSFAVTTTGIKDSVAGKSLAAEVEGMYLFGAPMQNAKFQVDVSRQKFSPAFDNYPDFNFADQRYSYYGESDEQDTGFFTGLTGKLAANGRYAFSIPLTAMAFTETIDLPEKSKLRLASSYTLNVDASVKDVDDKSVANQKTARVYAGAHMVGIRARERYAKAGDEMQFEIVALNTDGRPAGEIPVRLQFLHVTWKSVRTQGADESLQTRNNAVRRLVSSQLLTASDRPQAVAFRPDKGGEYYLVAQAEGESGFSRTAFYASGESDGFYLRDDDSVSLVADKGKYKPGDIANIVVQSPVKNGRVILSLEREKVYWYKQVEIKDYAISVPVEIKEEYLPNVYLTALILKPREKLSKRTLYEDLGAPGFKVGSINLPVDTRAREAKFALAYDRPQYGPGDTVKISIQTEPAAEVALSVADRAVLDLVNYHFADPVAHFFDNWPLGIELFENRHAIIHQYDFSGKGSNPGGGPGEFSEGSGSGGFALDSESGSRKNFRYTAFWKSDVKADQDGKAEITFTLPDNLSTFRIMALTAGDGKYAQYEKEFQVRKPLVVQPVVPRFMRPGDELSLGAVVINQTGEAAEFEVMLQGDLLNATPSRRVEIGAGASLEVSFAGQLNLVKYAELLKAHLAKPAAAKTEKASEPAIVLSGFVTANLVKPEALIAKGFKPADLRDRVKIEFPVLESPAAEAFAIAGFTDSKTEEAVTIPAQGDILGNLGSLDLTLSSTALIGLDKAFRFYSVNPYFCLEQRASAFLLAITSGELLQQFAIRPTASENYDFARIESLFLGEIGDFVNADGGLMLWKSGAQYNDKSNPYLSAYVLTVLQAAERKKISTPSSVRAGIVKYLDGFLRKEVAGSQGWALESYALINLALAKEGAYRKDLTKFLLKNEDRLSVRAKARLALAIAAREKIKSYQDDSDTKRLVDFFKSRFEVTATSVMIKEAANSEITQAFYSPTSALALVLQVLVELDKDNPLIPQIVTHLLKGKAGYDTHSIGLMASALDAYRSQYEAGSAAFSFLADINLGGKSLFSQQLDSHRLDVHRKALSIPELRKFGTGGQTLPMAFSKSGDRGRLYYSARLNYASLKSADQARDEGIELQRNLFEIVQVNGRPVAQKIRGNRLRRGELYLQKLMLTTPKPYYNVVVVDPLASQTEVMNAAFQTEKSGSGNVTEPEANNKPDEAMHDEGYYYGTRPSRIEYRHDKVVMFFDYIPPGFHEYRYVMRPLVRGRGTHPAGQAKLMYEPEIFGRSASTLTIVE